MAFSHPVPPPPPSCTPLPPVGRRAPARTAGKATGPRARPHGGPPSHLLHFQTTITSFPPCHAIHTCTDSKGWVWGDPPPPYTHTPAHVSCHLTPCGGPSPSLAPFFTDLAGPDRPLPAQTHTPNMPPHVHFPPPPQAHGGGGGGNRPHGPGISTQVRMNRSRPRVVRAVGRRRRLLFVIVLCCGHTTPRPFSPPPQAPELGEAPNRHRRPGVLTEM